MNKETLTGQATDEQIKAWKEKHEKVFFIKVLGSIGYLRKPSRKALSYASIAGQKDPLKFNEVLLNDCWLGGDDTIKTDDTKFLSVSQDLAKIVEVAEAELGEL
ncbi:MAG: hypothetical protein LBI45_02110 [Bacteroidales bacterium]|jgi:hypothetical protein|nr:hypothetical protein [Bacteroidales bacterium]